MTKQYLIPNYISVTFTFLNAAIYYEVISLLGLVFRRDQCLKIWLIALVFVSN